MDSSRIWVLNLQICSTPVIRVSHCYNICNKIKSYVNTKHICCSWRQIVINMILHKIFAMLVDYGVEKYCPHDLQFNFLNQNIFLLFSRNMHLLFHLQHSWIVTLRTLLRRPQIWRLRQIKKETNMELRLYYCSICYRYSHYSSHCYFSCSICVKCWRMVERY